MFKRVNNFLAALDVGSTKISAVIGEVSENGSLRIKGVGTSTSSGIKKSGIENPIELTASIKRAMLRAERMSGLVAEQCLLSFSGPFVRSELGDGEMNLADESAVSQSDVDQLLDHVAGGLRRTGEKILHLVPVQYRVDNHVFSTAPVGQSGSVLRVRVLAILASEEICQQFTKACGRASIKVAESVLPVFANFELLPEKIKNKKILLIDLGGKFTEVGFFNQRQLESFAIVPLGSAHLSHDIAYGLNVSLQEAERIKILYGRVGSDPGETGDDYLEIGMGEDRAEGKKISKKFLSQIVSARIRETLQKVKAEVDKMVGSEGLEEAVITGGGSLIKGIEDEAADVLGIPVVRERIVYNNELVSSPVYNVGVGLILSGLKKGFLKPVPVPRNFLYQMVGETKRWFQEFF